MKRWASWLAVVLLLGCFSILGASCGCSAGDDDDDDADDDVDDEVDIDAIDPLVAEGKRCLAVGDGVCAWDAFNEALGIDPDSTDANFGLVLADQLLLSDLGRQLLYILSILAGTPQESAAKNHQPLEFGSFLQGMLDEVLVGKSEEMESSLDVCSQRESFRFDLDNYPIVWNGRVLDEVEGEWDSAEAAFLFGPVRLLGGVVGSLVAYDLNFDVTLLAGIDLDGAPAEVLGRIIDVMLDILNDPDYPDFLILTDDGDETLQQAGIAFGFASLAFPNGFVLVRAETDDQADDVVAYVDRNGNGGYDEGEPYRVPIFGELTSEQSELIPLIEELCTRVGASFLDGTEYDLDPDNPNPFLLSDLNDLLVALGILPSPLLPSIPFDLGKPFREPTPDGLKNILIEIFTWLDGIFPAPEKDAGDATAARARRFQPLRTVEPLSPRKETDRIWTDGRWFRDQSGRVVLLRGAQVIEKHYPYLSWHEPSDFDRLLEWGFFAVRFGTVWAAVEPEKGVYDDDYLAALAERIEWCRERGIYVILDMHQDMYAEQYGGDGAPEWACLDDGIPHEIVYPWYMNYFSPAVMRAFDNFWRNKDGVQDAFVAMWQHVVEYFADEPAVIGYDLLNEPSFGTSMPAYCHPYGFDHQYLQPFYEKLIGAIREVDSERICFFEPNILKGGGLPSFIGKMEFDNIAFAPHYYEPNTSIFEYYDLKKARIEENMRLLDEESEGMNAPWWMGEFGLFNAAVVNGEQCMRDVLDAMDEHFGSWNFWSYEKGGGMALLNPDYTETKWVDMLVRPYPVATAGVPQELSFALDTKLFTYTYREDANAEGPTVLFVPLRHYPDGFEIDCSDPDGSWSYSWDEESQLLELYVNRELDEHTITIEPL